MQKNPRKKFLPSESPKSNFRKSGGSRSEGRSGGGKYGSKSFRPENERAGDFEDLIPKKKTRGYGGSDNQRPRADKEKPLYSTGGKRFTSQGGSPIFREVRDNDSKPPRRKNDERDFERENKPAPKPAFRPANRGGFSRDEPRPFLKKDFGGRGKQDRDQYRGDGELPKKPFRSGSRDNFSRDEPRPFLKKDFGGRGRQDRDQDSGDGIYSKRPYRSNRNEGFSGGDEPRPFIRKKEFNPEFEKRNRDDERGDSRSKPVRKSGTPGRGPARPFREKREFKPKFAQKKSYDKKASRNKKAKEPAIDLTQPFRLNKYLAHAGIASRREADELIKSGFVTVNGQVVLEMGHKVQPGDEVRFKHRLISPEKKVYILLNKPKDYITTASDERGRATVMDLVQDATDLRIYPVGRLDRNTTGLLILTNDGELAQKLTHPSFEAKKVYLATLDKALKKEDMYQISEGVDLEEGKALVDAVEYADPRDKRKIGIEIHIGWNKVVRRIFETLGYEVVQLDRVYYAGLTKDVPRGKWRNLTEKEVIMLKHFTK